MGKSKINVLIVDDNVEFCNILCDYLSTYENINIVGIANDGLVALELIPEKKPDLVLLDVLMPRLDGITVLMELSKITFEQTPKIIMLSTAEQVKITQRAISLGADYYFIKPFDMLVLYQRILQLFNSSMKDHQVIDTASDDKVHNNNLTDGCRVDLEKQLSAIIKEAGIPTHIRGYNFIKAAITLLCEDIETPSLLGTEIYLSIAKKYNTTQSRVERAIGQAIEYSYLEGKVEIFDRTFGYIERKNTPLPTNDEFITMLIDRLRPKN